MPAQEDLIAAVQSGDTAQFRDLLARDPGLVKTRDASGVSALMHAIYLRNPEMITLILAAHPDLDIFEAACSGKTDRLTALLDADPDLANAYSADGFTALHFAAFFSQPAAARLLLERGADTKAIARNGTQVMPLHSAAAGRNLEVVELLLQHGAPVNAKQQEGWTALHSAAQSGDRKMVEVLLRHGADPGAVNEKGVLPVQLAQEKGHGDVARLLAA